MAENQGHPAWQEILDVLPEEFHTLIKPQLAKWDAGVKEKIDSMHEQYAPYKEFVDNKVDPQIIRNGVGLLNEIQTNPGEIAKQVIETFELDYVTKEELDEAVAQAGNNDQITDPDDFSGLEDDPRFQKLMTGYEEIMNKLNAQEQENLSKTEQQKLDETLEALRTEKGDFDNVYVMALMANGVPGEKAVEQYHNTINQAVEGKLKENNITLGNGTSDSSAPVVMNGGGDAGNGTGIPSEPVELGDLADKDVNSLVVELLTKGSQE